MKLKLGQLLLIDQTLGTLANQKVDNIKLVYKLYKLKAQTEEKLKPVYKLLEERSDDDKLNDLLDEEEALEIEPLTVDDLGAFSLSIKDIADLQPILKED